MIIVCPSQWVYLYPVRNASIQQQKSLVSGTHTVWKHTMKCITKRGQLGVIQFQPTLIRYMYRTFPCWCWSTATDTYVCIPDTKLSNTLHTLHSKLYLPRLANDTVHLPNRVSLFYPCKHRLLLVLFRQQRTCLLSYSLHLRPFGLNARIQLGLKILPVPTKEQKFQPHKQICQSKALQCTQAPLMTKTSTGNGRPKCSWVVCKVQHKLSGPPIYSRWQVWPAHQRSTASRTLYELA